MVQSVHRNVRADASAKHLYNEFICASPVLKGNFIRQYAASSIGCRTRRPHNRFCHIVEEALDTASIANSCLLPQLVYNLDRSTCIARFVSILNKISDGCNIVLCKFHHRFSLHCRNRGLPIFRYQSGGHNIDDVLLEQQASS